MYRADHIIFFTIICILFSGISVKATDTPFTVKKGLFDQSRPDDLGLTTAPGTETVTVFRPSDETDHFSNGVPVKIEMGTFPRSALGGCAE
ncbi:MAG TPA: hypothetical protein PLE24_15375 [Chitinispirillaceae bacterium]|jgi:hypothetical protein|nr:hypothetical protein [Chitinispirillaceae bacterium]